MDSIIWPGWRVVRRIGNGSFGKVYEIGRDVDGIVEKAALKVISIPRDESDLNEFRMRRTEEYISSYYTKYNQSTPQYIVRNWTGYHEHGEQIQMKVFYSPEGQYIGNIRIDKTNNKSNSSSRSPFSIPGEGMHNLK